MLSKTAPPTLSRPTLEVADIFRRFGAAWRAANEAHVSLAQRRVMTAIEICRTAALGGHVERCENCAHTRIAYNSCRNRHCPKCQWQAAQAWLEARKAELLPVPYFHIVFTLPAALRAIAYQNKTKVYGLLFAAAAETLTTIAADPKHLGAHIGVTAVLHTWGQQLDHHPHLHCIVPGGGLSPEGDRWLPSRPNFLVHVRVLSALFRRLFLTGLAKLHAGGELQFFGGSIGLQDAATFKAHLARLAHKKKWVVYAKRPFAGPEQVLAYLARYTHRVAISNRRLIEIGDDHVSFRWKDYREDGSARSKVMRLAPGEFMRRFLLHVLPDGFHRIRHYGLFANGHRADKLALCRRLLDVPAVSSNSDDEHCDGGEQVDEQREPPPCPCCGGKMKVTEIFDGPMSRPYSTRRLDTS
jgi:putative transposase/transposase-like zinc-binding protein